MLRYIYFLCFLVDFELVFCYNSIRSSNKSHRSAARVRRRKVYGSEDSPLTSIDLVSFMQKPDDPEELLASYNLENKRRQADDEKYQTDDSTPSMRRARHEAAGDVPRAPGQRPSLRARPKKKCSFSMFPFFSCKNKTKPAGPKHKKRRSHSFNFFRSKNVVTSLPVTTLTEKYSRSHLELQIDASPKTDGTAKHRMSPHFSTKMKRAKKSFQEPIHNSRQYYANHHRMNDTEWMKEAVLNDIRNDSTQEERGSYKGNNRREKSFSEKFTDHTVSDLLMKQNEQRKILEELESRIKESYHLLRHSFRK